MASYLAARLQKASKKLQLNEQTHLTKLKEYGAELESFAETGEATEQPQNLLDMDFGNLAQRDQELNKMIKSVDELATIYKDMQVLVKEQGSILDRIECTVEDTRVNMVKANEELEEADKNLSKNCARNANLFLIGCIFVLSLLLIMTFTN